MRNEEAMRTVWLLYHPPVKGESRTGHAGLLVTQKVDKVVKAVYYFSLYHALLPDDIRKMGWGERFSTSVPSVTVVSYEDDRAMRGQSWTLSDADIRENEAVQDLIAKLPTDPKLREKYFNRGAYKYAIRLPQTINVDVVISELERIKNTASWAMAGPITRSLFLDPTAYNCCSAVDSALEKGMQKPYQKGHIGDLLEVSKKVLSLMYFMTLMFSPDVTLSCDNPATVLWFVPAVYLVIQAVRNAIEFIFINDLKVTPLGNLEKSKLLPILTGFFSIMNLICAPLAIKATNAFIYPTSLAKKVEKEYGGELSNAGFEDFPKLQMC